MGEMMRALIVLAVVVVAVSALPLGSEEHLALLDEGAPHDAFMRKQVHDFKTSLESSQGEAHPDDVSAALSDAMDEEFDEQHTLEQLEQDNEQIGEADDEEDEPELGETPSTTATSAGADAAMAKAKDEEEMASLDKQAKAAKKLEKKNEHLFDKMGKDLQAKADMKKQVKEVQDAAKKALHATGSDKDTETELGDSKFDFDAFEAKYGKKGSSKKTSTYHSKKSSPKTTSSYSSDSISDSSTDTFTSTSTETEKEEATATDAKI